MKNSNHQQKKDVSHLNEITIPKPIKRERIESMGSNILQKECWKSTKSLMGEHISFF